jgi:hypothetical protein
MCNRDYTKEVGLNSGVVTVPLRIALPIVAVLAAVTWYGMNVGLAEYHAKQQAPVAATPARVSSR